MDSIITWCGMLASMKHANSIVSVYARRMGLEYMGVEDFENMWLHFGPISSSLGLHSARGSASGGMAGGRYETSDAAECHVFGGAWWW